MTWIHVGFVRRAHGIAGEVLVAVETDDPELIFVEGRELRVLSGAPPGMPTTLSVERARPHKAGFLLRVRELADRTVAELYRGAELGVPLEELRESEPGEYFLHDLPGYAVRRMGGDPVGTVATVYETATAPILGVRDDGREVLVPFHRRIVRRVDEESRTIWIDPPVGLLEL